MSKKQLPAIERHKFLDGEECSATRCPHPPIFICTSPTEKGGIRKLKYCFRHGSQFARNNDLPMPMRTADDVRTMNFGKYETDALEALIELAKKELIRRGGPVVVEFKETGVQGKGPYVAYLYSEDNKIMRRFHDAFEREEAGEGRVLVKGEYPVEPGEVIEKRLGGDEVKPWTRYLIADDGKEIWVGDENHQNYVLVLSYLKGDITISDLLAKCGRSWSGDSKLI